LFFYNRERQKLEHRRYLDLKNWFRRFIPIASHERNLEWYKIISRVPPREGLGVAFASAPRGESGAKSLKFKTK
jgi:hypothetical protein